MRGMAKARIWKQKRDLRWNAPDIELYARMLAKTEGPNAIQQGLLDPGQIAEINDALGGTEWQKSKTTVE